MKESVVMNDLKYVLINIICFLLMSCGSAMSMHESDREKMESIRREIQGQEFYESMQLPRRPACSQTMRKRCENALTDEAFNLDVQLPECKKKASMNALACFYKPSAIEEMVHQLNSKNTQQRTGHKRQAESMLSEDSDAQADSLSVIGESLGDLDQLVQGLQNTVRSCERVNQLIQERNKIMDSKTIGPDQWRRLQSIDVERDELAKESQKALVQSTKKASQVPGMTDFLQSVLGAMNKK